MPAFLPLNKPFSGQPDNHIVTLIAFASIFFLLIQGQNPEILVKNIENW